MSSRVCAMADPEGGGRERGGRVERCRVGEVERAEWGKGMRISKLWFGERHRACVGVSTRKRRMRKRAMIDAMGENNCCGYSAVVDWCWWWWCCCSEIIQDQHCLSVLLLLLRKGVGVAGWLSGEGTLRMLKILLFQERQKCSS